MTASPADISADAIDLATGASTSINALQSVLQANAATSRDVRNIRASLTGYRADLATLRVTMDVTDVVDTLIVDTADRRIGLWKWERGLRHNLVVLSGNLLEAETVAEQLELGIKRTVYAVRSGDTLQSIAARELGDWREYKRLAEANGIPVGTLEVGQVLVIPAKT